MSEGHDIKTPSAGSYRFGGYQPKRDLNKNIIKEDHDLYRGELWQSKSLRRERGEQPHESLGSK